MPVYQFVSVVQASLAHRQRTASTTSTTTSSSSSAAAASGAAGAGVSSAELDALCGMFRDIDVNGDGICGCGCGCGCGCAVQSQCDDLMWCVVWCVCGQVI